MHIDYSKVFSNSLTDIRFTSFPSDSFMPFIAILGCDGSGKSSVIDELTQQLSRQGQMVSHGHWRPRVFGDYRNPKIRTIADNPHSSQPRGPITSSIKLLWISFNWWFEWLRVLRRSSRNGYLIYDRFHSDLLVDPIRYRYGGSQGLANIFSQLMPQPDLVIYLDAPSEILLSRKSEVSKEALNEARENYLKLCSQHNNYFVLDASNSIYKVVSKVLDIINSFDGNN